MRKQLTTAEVLKMVEHNTELQKNAVFLGLIDKLKGYCQEIDKNIRHVKFLVNKHANTIRLILEMAEGNFEQHFTLKEYSTMLSLKIPRNKRSDIENECARLSTELNKKSFIDTRNGRTSFHVIVLERVFSVYCTKNNQTNIVTRVATKY